MIALQYSPNRLNDLDTSRILLGLERMSRLMDRLGNPERYFRSIHIAGTNGKGSTAEFISSILDQAGYRTGLYTSPHLERFGERIKTGGEEIAEEEIRLLSMEVEDAARTVPSVEPTFFESVTALAFLHFARKGVDIAVVETGLGGRLDATNVITPLISVITPVALDHCEYLGGTLKEVAAEKGGIIKEGVPLILGRQEADVSVVIAGIAEEKRAPLYAMDRDFGWEAGSEDSFMYHGIFRDIADISCSMYGEHQHDNAAAAIAAVEVLERVGITAGDDAVRCGVGSAFMPGRFEAVPGDLPIILDGAHNPAGTRVLVKALRARFHGKEGVFVVGFMGDKDIGGMVKELSPVASKMIFTRPDQERAFDPEGGTGYIRECTAGVEVEILVDMERAIKEGIDLLKDETFLVVTGSLYTVGEARRILGRRR